LSVLSENSPFLKSNFAMKANSLSAESAGQKALLKAFMSLMTLKSKNDTLSVGLILNRSYLSAVQPKRKSVSIVNSLLKCF
jgi:hypothetical protein